MNPKNVSDKTLGIKFYIWDTDDSISSFYDKHSIECTYSADCEKGTINPLIKYYTTVMEYFIIFAYTTR